MCYRSHGAAVRIIDSVPTAEPIGRQKTIAAIMSNKISRTREWMTVKEAHRSRKSCLFDYYFLTAFDNKSES